MPRIRITAQGPGIGDAMWLSAPARQFAKEHRSGKLVINSNHPELFDLNPNVYRALPLDAPLPEGYTHVNLEFNPPEHAIDGYCRQMGLEPTEHQQEIVFDNAELDKARDFIIGMGHAKRPIAALHPSAGPWTPNKTWPWDKWEELAARLVGNGCHVLTVGAPGERVLKDSTAAQFKRVRLSAALLFYCKAFCGGVSGPMHLANATRTRSVVIFGGREHPYTTGYPQNTNIYNGGGCEHSPCWMVEPCPHGFKCMEAISVSEVEDAVMEIVESEGA